MAKLSLKLERPHDKKDKTKKNEILLMLLMLQFIQTKDLKLRHDDPNK